MASRNLGDSSRPYYSYTAFPNVQIGQKKINLFGVVMSFRAPLKSKGNDYSCSLEMIDESGQQLKCLLFNLYQTKLPQHCDKGDVICLHRVNVANFNGNRQVLGQKYSSWIIFKSNSQGRILPETCSEQYTFTEFDKRRVKALRSWASHVNILSTAPSTGYVSNAARPQQAVKYHPPPIAASTTSTSTAVAITSSSQPSAAPQHAPSSQLPPLQERNVFQPSTTKYYNIPIKTISELRSVTVFERVSLCGVVKYFKEPTPSRGPDHYVFIALVDEDDILIECIIFNPSKEKLARACHVGEVVLVKGLQLKYFQNILQCTGHEHTLIGIFPSDTATQVPRQIGSWYTLRPDEMLRIQQLKEWVHENEIILLNTKFGEFTCSHYFNTVCRVVSVARFDPLKIQVLSVYDGTKSNATCREVNLGSSKYNWQVQSNPVFNYVYLGLTHDVFVYGLEKNVRVGDLVLLRNVYSFPIPLSSASTAPENQPKVELKITMRASYIYHGKVVVLPDDSAVFRQVEDMIPLPYGPFPTWRQLPNTPHMIGTVVSGGLLSASIEEVKRAPVGSIRYCEVEVIRSGSGTLTDFCQLRCSECKMRYADMKPEDIVNSHDLGACLLTEGDPCIYCNDMEEEDTALLKYMYVFSLHVRDETGELEMFVSDKEGARFLSKLPPKNLHCDLEAREKLLDVLYSLTGGNDPFVPLPADPKFNYRRPLLRCCIMSYTSHTNKQRYSLIDTVLQ